MYTLSPDAQALLTSLPDGALWCYDDRIVAANALAAELLGTPVERLIERSIWDFVHPDDEERLKARYRARRSGLPVPEAYEIDLVRPDGTRARVEIVPRALEGPDLLILLRDRRVQAFESQLVLALSYAAEKVQRARSVRDALEVAAFGLKEQGIALHIGRVQEGHLIPTYAPSNSALIRLLDSVLGPGADQNPIPVSSLKVADGVIQRQHEVYVDDLAGATIAFLRRVAPSRPIPEGALVGQGYAQGMFAPLLVEGRTWGVALFASDRLTRSQGAALHLFNAQLSGALEVVEAIERLDRAHRQVEGIQAVLEAGTDPTLIRMVPALLEIVCATTASDVAVLYLTEGEGLVQNSFRVGSDEFAAELPLNLPSEVAPVERASALPGARWTNWKRPEARDQLTFDLELLPLRSQGRLAGLVILGRRSGPYGSDELRDGEMLADQIAVQLEKARLLQDARDRVDELDLLLDVGRVITESVESQRIYDVAMTSLERMLSCDQAFIWLHDDGAGVLRGAACADPANREVFLQARLNLNEPSGAVRAMLTGQPVRIAAAAGSEQLHQPLRIQFNLRSVLVLPLLHHDTAIGAISVADTRKERVWTDPEVERATVIARQLAVALANARLFVDLRRSYDDLARTQAELVKRERLAALGELAAVVAHEVRNPLGVIFNSISSLRRRGATGADSEMLLGIVAEEADRLNRIVGDLLDFSRPHEPDLRLVPLPPLLGGVRDAVGAHNGSGVVITVEVEEGLPHVRVDGRMMRQALLNLALNAIQAMPKGGTLTVRATRSLDRPGIRIEVGDTGPGIAAATVQRIFEPFYTTKATGTGLGLAVVKRFVDAHQGEVTVTSKLGEGTTFAVWIPEDRSAT